MAKAASNELKLTRVYDAPIQAVWDAWNDPEQAAQWWGPRGFTITTHSKDLRVGGHWHYTMHGPDGTDYENKTKYFVVDDKAKLVYDHGGSDTRKPLFRVTVLFFEVNGQTKLDMTMTFSSVDAAEESRVFIKKAGGNGTWDRLAEYLEKQSSGTEVFVINRSFDCSVEKMFDLWTNADHLASWLPPVGMTMQFIDANIREGGTSFYVMSGNDMKFYGKLHYLKIQRPRFLEYTQMFCDEEGNLSRHPKAPTWPEVMHTTVLLTPEGADQTRVTVRWQPQGKPTAEELAAFVQMRGGMTQGWTGSFDKLEAMVGG